MMPGLRLTVETVTPLLMNGADQTPQLRAASFRGVFRYWLRAVLGGAYQGDIEALHKAESRYFGSTDQGSALRVRVGGHLTPTDEQEKFVLPPTYQNGKAATHQGFHESQPNDTQQFWIQFDSHPLNQAVFDAPFYASLLLAFHFGAFGKRSRRGGGVLRITAVQASWDDTALQHFRELACFVPDSSVNLQNFLNNTIISYIDQTQQERGYVPENIYGNIPKYPIWSSEHVKVLVKGEGYRNYDIYEIGKKNPPFAEGYRVALRDLWDLSGTLHHMEGAWGYAKSQKRRASAVHMRVFKNKSNAYYPMITMLRSGNPDEKWDELETLSTKLAVQKYALLSFSKGVWV